MVARGPALPAPTFSTRDIRVQNGGLHTIRFSPLWETMAAKKVTTYPLRVKHGMRHATVQRLQADMPVSTHTRNRLCAILDYELADIAKYIPDKK